MSEQKSSKKRGKANKFPKEQQSTSSQSSIKQNASGQEDIIPTKFDIEIAKFLRFNLPDKMAMFVGIKRVNYFIGSKAVDLLIESKYAGEGENHFKSREEIVLFLNNLLIKKYFHRAKKIVKLDGSKKKFKLDMHNDQIFEDSKEPYVWLYEPISLKAWLQSIGLIIVVVAICLFPLWPPEVRTGVYYLCIGSLIILGSFFMLWLTTLLVYSIVYAISFGRVHIWLFPNLVADVGFFESFVPVYSLSLGQSSGSDEGASDGVASLANPTNEGHQD